MEALPQHYQPYLSHILYRNTVILEKINELAQQVALDNQDTEIKLVCILKGGFRFTHDLMNALYKLTTRPITIEFIKVKSYINDNSDIISISEIMYEDYNNKNIIICEDIIDTGKTMRLLVDEFNNHCNTSKISIASLFLKNKVFNFKPDYVGFEIPNEFIVGYGLDYNEMFRDLDHVCIINNNGKEHFKSI